MTSREKKNDRLGMGISIGLHLALFILFIFLLAWKEPFPPLPEYGIEVNFGLDNAGSGNIQPQTPANNNPTPVEDPAPEQPAPTQQEEITEPVTETVQQEAAPAPTETPEITEPVEEPEVTQPEPNIVPEKEATKEEVIEKEPEPKKEPKLDPAASYPSKQSTTSGANGSTGAANEPASSNQGDKTGETGDQGDPDGEIDSRALYGKPGGGAGGAALDMAGWNWDFLPRPQDTSNETGHIVFEVKIDEDGEILSIRTIEKSVSDPLVKIYRSEVAKLTFSPTSANSRPAPTSTGRITFIIKSR